MAKEGRERRTYGPFGHLRAKKQAPPYPHRLAKGWGAFACKGWRSAGGRANQTP